MIAYMVLNFPRKYKQAPMLLLNKSNRTYAYYRIQTPALIDYEVIDAAC